VKEKLKKVVSKESHNENDCKTSFALKNQQLGYNKVAGSKGNLHVLHAKSIKRPQKVWCLKCCKYALLTHI
jgi:hypothetical protein